MPRIHVPHRWYAVVVACTAALACACEPIADPQDYDREPAPIFKRSSLVTPAVVSAPARLKVVAWNIKYGAGRIPFWFDCWGDRSQMSRAEVDANMAKLYAAIVELDPDVLIAEEIEVNSKRSAYFDMVKGILENTNLNYATFASTWNSKYIASEGVGRIHLGNAIFSKHKITKAERIRQVDRTDQDALTSMFYLKRALGRVEIEVKAGTKVAIWAVHSEAYDNDGTKKKQIEHIDELLKKEPLPFMVGGDFNELPPIAVRKQGFMDEREKAVCSADFAQPPYTPEIMQRFYDNYVAAIALDRYGKSELEQKRFFTHSVLGPDEVNDKGEKGFWNRTLDYLFASKGTSWVVGSTDVAQQKGQKIGGENGIGPVLTTDPVRLSDHAPVVGTWEVP